MENEYNVRRLALILAIQAEIEAMKAENLRFAQGECPTFTNEHFDDKAAELRNLAYAHNEQPF